MPCAPSTRAPGVEAVPERERRETRSVGSEVLQAGDGGLARRRRALGDPPQAEHRSGWRLEELAPAAEEFHVSRPVREAGKSIDRLPHRQVRDLEVVTERLDPGGR